MRKSLIIIFIFIIFLLISSTISIGSSSTTYLYLDTLKIDDSNIEVLSNEIAIDTTTSKIENIINLKNISNTEIEINLSFPLENEELGISIRDLTIKLNGVQVDYVKSTDGNYLVKTKISANSGKKINIISTWYTTGNVKVKINYSLDNPIANNIIDYGKIKNGAKVTYELSEPSDDILRQAKESNIEFDMTGIGKDGFVFIVNKDNPVNSLTIEQIQKIYTGEITNWSQVGGNNEEIVAYQREQNSGSQNLMEKMVMKDIKMKNAPSGLMISSMEGLIDSVAKSYDNSKSSIGYSIYIYAKEQYVKDNIKFLSINGVYPTDETIANGSYPLSKIVYAITRKDVPEDSNVRELISWLLTSEGQKIVVEGGYSKIK